MKTLARVLARRPVAGRLAPALLAVLSPAFASAQVVEVAVTTADGNAAAGQPVVLRNPDTGFRAEALTGTTGRARFEAVPSGRRYAVDVAGINEMAEFALRSNESKAVAVQVIDEVTVTASSARSRLDRLDAEVSASLSAPELASLPVEGREVTRALVRLPNVTAATGFFPEAPAISINGANGLNAQYLIDGFDNNENFLGGPKFPLSTGYIADVAVLASSYSVEYGRTGSGVVNATTRSGTNDWTGEAFYLTRPGQPLDATSRYPGRDLSGNTVRDGFERQQFGIGVAGALSPDRTFVFADVEYTVDQKDNRLDSPSLGVAAVVPGSNRSLLASVKLEHRLTDEWRLGIQVHHGDVSIERQGGGLDGGVTFPSAGSTQDRQSTLVGATAIYSGSRLTSETRVGYSRFNWDYGRPAGGASPQAVVEGPDGLAVAVIGHPGFAFADIEDSWQLKQGFSWVEGRHALRVGADLLHSSFSLAGGGNPDGNYRVRLTDAQLGALRARNLGTALSVADLPADVTIEDYAVELQPARFGRDQLQAALYAQDQISLSPRTTLTAGVRWDYDRLTKAGARRGDFDNIAPRLALHFRYDERLSFRVGGGIYFDRLPYTVLSDALQQNTTSAPFRAQLSQLVALGLLPADTDLARVTFDGNLSVNPACTGPFPLCPTPATAADLRATASSGERRLLAPGGLDSPYSVQWSGGVQWQATDTVLASVDLIVAHGYHQARLRDLNAPAPFSPNLERLTGPNIALLRAQPDDASRRNLASALGLVRLPEAADTTRPVAVLAGGARQIVVTETEGSSDYRALSVTLRKPLAEGRLGYLVSYTLSRLANDTDDINFRASNSNEFAAEWGPSVNDRRHVIAATVFARLNSSTVLTLAGLFQSGQPVNLIPDTAIFGTTDINGDGSAFSSAYLGNADRSPGAARNSGRLPWSASIDAGIRYTALGGKIEVSADVFNVLDRNNLSGFANSATQSNQIQVDGSPFTQRNAGAPRQFQFGVRYLF